MDSPPVSNLFSRASSGMSKPTGTKMTPYHLAALLRREPDPTVALSLFLGPILKSSSFRYSSRCYDLIISKLSRARMLASLKPLLARLLRLDAPRVSLKEPLFCHVIAAYGRAGLPGPAHRLFLAVPAFGPRRTTRSLNSLLHALLTCGTNIDALVLSCHELSEATGLDPDACTYNILIRAAATSGSLPRAFGLFDEMLKRRMHPSVVTFGTLIAALCENSRLDEAFRLKEAMLGSYNLRPNVYIYTSLIKGLCMRDELDSALKLKEEILLDKELVLDSAVYATLIRALFRARRKGEVIDMLEEMKGKGVRPDTVAYNAIIAGFCEDEKDFDAAFEALEEMARSGCKADVVSYNTVIAALCKEGRWRDARELFEDLPRRGCPPDVVTYRTLFDGMCGAGEIGEADMLMDEMVFKGYAPGKEGVRKFVEAIGRGGDGILVQSVLCRLAKVNALELSIWEKAVGNVLKDPQKQVVVMK